MAETKTKTKKQTEKKEIVKQKKGDGPVVVTAGKACWSCGGKTFHEEVVSNGTKFMKCECGASQ